MPKRKKHHSHKKQVPRGFTIIEVMIVLAIAGVLLLVVLLAVPALQRNSRNYQYKNYANRVAAELQSQHNLTGKFPIPTGAGGEGAATPNIGFCDYIRKYIVTNGSAISCEVNEEKECVIAEDGIVTICLHGYNGKHEYLGPPGELSIMYGHSCNTPLHNDGTDNVIYGTHNAAIYRKYVIWIVLEKVDKPYCIDNEPS